MPPARGAGRQVSNARSAEKVFTNPYGGKKLPFPKQLTGEGTFIMLKVVGESMINAAITDDAVRGGPGRASCE